MNLFFSMAVSMLLSDVFVELISLNVFLVVGVFFLNVVVPFILVEVVVKMLLSNNFCQRTFVEQLVVGNVVFDVFLPVVLLDLMLSTMLVLNSANFIILMSGFVVEIVVAEMLSIFCC